MELTARSVIITHCQQKQLVLPLQLAKDKELRCCECDIPLLFKSLFDGEWYYVGEKVFECDKSN